jgi:hypothetical protein
VSQKSYSALHALLSAIDPEGINNSADGKLTTDAITKLSERLSELVGPEVIESFKKDRNERGEVWCFYQCLDANFLISSSARE